MSPTYTAVLSEDLGVDMLLWLVLVLHVTVLQSVGEPEVT